VSEYSSSYSSSLLISGNLFQVWNSSSYELSFPDRQIVPPFNGLPEFIRELRRTPLGSGINSFCTNRSFLMLSTPVAPPLQFFPHSVVLSPHNSQVVRPPQTCGSGCARNFFSALFPLCATPDYFPSLIPSSVRLLPPPCSNRSYPLVSPSFPEFLNPVEYLWVTLIKNSPSSFPP